jgi:hypothetical protein
MAWGGADDTNSYYFVAHPILPGPFIVSWWKGTEATAVDHNRHYR